MLFMYIYIPATQKYKIANTSEISKFSDTAFDSDDDECKKRPYKLTLANGKFQICQVLKTRSKYSFHVVYYLIGL